MASPPSSSSRRPPWPARSSSRGPATTALHCPIQPPQQLLHLPVELHACGIEPNPPPDAVPLLRRRRRARAPRGPASPEESVHESYPRRILMLSQCLCAPRSSTPSPPSPTTPVTRTSSPPLAPASSSPTILHPNGYKGGCSSTFSLSRASSLQPR